MPPRPAGEYNVQHRGMTMGMTASERRRLWVRAGGRCTLCKKYLLEGGLTYKNVFVGEDAHIVGQQNSAGSPRGLDPLPDADRDLAENILLACSNCHTEIDKRLIAGLIDKRFLYERKREHEDEIRHQTGLTRDRRTVVLRMAGDIRGASMELPKEAAVQAVVQSGGRFPCFLQAYDQQSVEIDLRHIDGESVAGPDYYAAAARKIDAAIDQRVRPGMLSGDIEHLSVFAIARLPLLVYLGTRLDDGVATDVYQRHRRTDGWIWDTHDSGTDFDIALVGDRTGAPEDAVLITNLSGTTPLTDLPRALADATVFRCSPDTGPAEDVFAHPAVLARFEAALRAFFTGLEATHKHVKRVHLIGALPVAGAVSLGRILKGADLRPALVTYDRTDCGYTPALEM